MNYTLNLRLAAIEDIRETGDYYEGLQRDLGDDFLEQTSDLLFAIESNPHLFATREGKVRTANLRRFPYQVVYVIDGQHVEVLAVFHQSRHPDSWRNRL